MRRECGRSCGSYQQVIVPAEHAWSEWVVIDEATCFDNGLQRRECEYCDDYEYRVVSMDTAHNFQRIEVIKSATCGAPGIELWRCTNCGTEEERVSHATGCRFGEWEIVQEATCSRHGYRERVCQNDPTHVMRERIPALGHEWGEWIVLVEPTCLLPGIRIRVCQVCVASGAENPHTQQETISPLGSKFGEDVGTAATEFEDGYILKHCERCDKCEPYFRWLPAYN